MHAEGSSEPRRGLRGGDVVGPYRVERRLGHGGMAELYVAAGPKGRVALKLLLPHLATDPDSVRMFLEEARWGSHLHHPNIVEVVDIGEAQGEYFMAMELVEGSDGRAFLQRAALQGVRIPFAVALHVVASVAEGLAHAHALPTADGMLCLLHRDVSPANILLGHDGSVKLGDFGLVKVLNATKHTATGVLKGKLAYMAPEQLEGRADVRSDIYALAVVLYELVCGVRCFGAENEFALMNRVAKGDYVDPRAIRPELPEALASVITRGMALDPNDRPPDVRAWLEALRSVAEQQSWQPSAAALRRFAADMQRRAIAPVEATERVLAPSTVVAMRPRPAARSRWGLWVGVLAVLALGVGAWGTASPASRVATVGVLPDFEVPTAAPPEPTPPSEAVEVVPEQEPVVVVVDETPEPEPPKRQRKAKSRSRSESKLDKLFMK